MVRGSSLLQSLMSFVFFFSIKRRKRLSLLIFVRWWGTLSSITLQFHPFLLVFCSLLPQFPRFSLRPKGYCFKHISPTVKNILRFQNLTLRLYRSIASCSSFCTVVPGGQGTTNRVSPKHTVTFIPSAPGQRSRVSASSAAVCICDSSDRCVTHTHTHVYGAVAVAPGTVHEGSWCFFFVVFVRLIVVLLQLQFLASLRHRWSALSCQRLRRDHFASQKLNAHTRIYTLPLGATACTPHRTQTDKTKRFTCTRKILISTPNRQ